MDLVQNPRIAIVGAGAVGCYYGGMLANAGSDVHFLIRSDYDAVREHGLRIETRGKTVHISPRAYRLPEEIGPCDFVIIGLKATGNQALEGLLPPLLKPDTALVTLQNGLGNEEFLAERWGAERVMGGLCFVCLNRTAPGVIEHYDHGSLSLGEYGRRPEERTRKLAELFRAAGIDSSIADNLVTERWRKLLWNIPFNGLCIAAGGATVADVLADDGLRTLARELIGEALDAARRLGHEIPEAFAAHQIDRSWSMGAYKPSSLIDWKAGHPVEVEAIWGEPWRQGVAAGARMDRIETLYRILQYAAAPATSPATNLGDGIISARTGKQ